MRDSKINIFDPYKLTSILTLNNRIVMAPMTRRFADKNYCPTEGMENYYTKRAEAGLLITEGTIISPDAIGYGNVPGIYTKEQVTAWKKIVTSVHNNDGHIFLQLWHCGRVSHPNFHQGCLPISASATVMTTPLGRTGLNCGWSREASLNEIKNLIKDYVHAAENAIEAGFDGIELHGANGYLIDQFLHYCSNKRIDEYGNNEENMSRFCLELITACGDAIGFERIGLRISPGGHMAEIITDSRDKLVFTYLLAQLSKIKIAYVHIGNFDDSITYPELENKTMTSFVRSKYSGTLITSGGYNYHTACNGINEQSFDLVALGRPFIANPDLITKLKSGSLIKDYVPSMLEYLK
ncbi:MAG: alkene reductase [Legionellales bacterium]|nr:alkene reductase [Legionellales bacterium]